MVLSSKVTKYQNRQRIRSNSLRRSWANCYVIKYIIYTNIYQHYSTLCILTNIIIKIPIQHNNMITYNSIVMRFEFIFSRVKIERELRTFLKLFRSLRRI